MQFQAIGIARVEPGLEALGLFAQFLPDQLELGNLPGGGGLRRRGAVDFGDHVRLRRGKPGGGFAQRHAVADDLALPPRERVFEGAGGQRLWEHALG